MLVWQKIKIPLFKLRLIPKKYYLLTSVLLLAVLCFVTLQERTLAYSYSSETCDQRLVLFPDVFRQAGGENYQITTKGGWSVAGRQVVATSLCVAPVEAPVENSSEVLAYAPWAGWVGRLAYKVEVGEHPVVDASALDEPIPISRELVLPLSEPDTTFSYKLGVGSDQEALCGSDGSQLACDVPSLSLKQGSKYAVTIERSFKDEEVSKVVSADIETLSPLSIIKSTIKKGATVYNKPKSIGINLDKSVEIAEFTAQRIDGDESVALPIDTKFDDKKVTIAFDDDLPRRAGIEIRATTLEAVDGSTPLDDYVLRFKTSGGPRVTGVNVDSSGVSIGTQIVVTFDQALHESQDINSLISTSGGVAFQAKQGNQILFSTNGAGRCGDISISLKPDIQSRYGISGQSAWKYSGRMSCYTISTIGYSALGRPINAYHFGDNGSSVVYTGAIHGNEFSTKYLMDRWIQELDANPGKIPTGKRIIVVPVINPDGLAAGTRSNARNIDLNRNFDVSDWQKDVQYPGGKSWPGGGGKKPMSEPETKAIAGFIAGLRPELVISYHSVANYVISNKHGQADSRAQQYASLSGYRLVAGGEGSFGYQISGTADDYYREKLGVASVLIELGSSSYHEFERNQAAMWSMMR